MLINHNGKYYQLPLIIFTQKRLMLIMANDWIMNNAH